MNKYLIENGYDFHTINGINIFHGIKPDDKVKKQANIEYYKELSNKKTIFTPIKPSTLTAKGEFTNISFNEEDIIDMLTLPKDSYIISIGCNFGELKNDKQLIKKEKKRLSNRGRKPKVKPKSKRKLQGSGAYFSSQITFEILNENKTKIYKIKLFRNGGFQVPGINKPDMTDLIFSITHLRDYLRYQFHDEYIDIKYMISVMRNYICKLINPTYYIKLNCLENVITKEKNAFISDNIKQEKLWYMLKGKENGLIYKIFQYLPEFFKNPIDIAEIQNNCERYFGLIIKFYRPTIDRINKRTTIKILKSGKINFDGGNSEEEIEELYYWLNFIFFKYKKEIIFDSNAEISDTSSDGASSIYDEE